MEEMDHEMADATIQIDVSNTLHAMEGFGTSASELSWLSLSTLRQDERDGIFRELFSSEGAAFTMVRTPIGASDFALDYYSYDDVDGDYSLEHFSIERDKNYLIPFLIAAQSHCPELKVWASPWCPPAWMKRNKHYANVSTEPIRLMAKQMLSQMESLPDDIHASGGSTFGFNPMNMPPNGLDEDSQIQEGEDAFDLSPACLDAYSRYFGKYVDAYKAEGINITMVMPQNEPNSAQWYPACTWTPNGLKQFIAVLGPEMQKRGIEVWLGTMERPDVQLWEQIVRDSTAGPYIKGLGFQWAGKEALPAMHAMFPELPCYMTEQECGNGANDWAGAMHSWDLMREYVTNGCQGYFYWNTSLFKGESSSWGWTQNSLITIDRARHDWHFTPEYYVIKHASHFVKPGAKVLALGGSHTDALAFVNPDGKIVLLVANQTEKVLPVSFLMGRTVKTARLPAMSLNTFLL